MAAAAALFAAGVVQAQVQAPAPAQPPAPATAPAPPPFTAVWDGVAPEAAEWTRILDEELRDHGDKLIDFVPADADEFCPGWADLDRHGREQVWITLVSAIAKHESSFDPGAIADEPPPLSEKSIGLLQLSLSDNRDFHCGFATEAEIEDPRNNLDCGVRILVELVLPDQVVGGGRQDNRVGAAAYWTVLNRRGHPRARAFIVEQTRSLPKCSS